MKVRVTRYGGQLPTLKPQREIDVATLDPAARTALGTILKSGHGAGRRTPDAFSYRFEVEQDDGSAKSVTVQESAVPEALLKHLP